MITTSLYFVGCRGYRCRLRLWKEAEARRLARNSVFADKIIRACKMYIRIPKKHTGYPYSFDFIHRHNARKAMRVLDFCRRFPGWLGGRYELKPFEGIAPGSFAIKSCVRVDTAKETGGDGSTMIPAAHFAPYVSFLATSSLCHAAAGSLSTTPPLRRGNHQKQLAAEELLARQCECGACRCQLVSDIGMIVFECLCICAHS
jgi:hypothetical protein